MSLSFRQVDSEESKFDWQDILQLPFLPQDELVTAATTASASLTPLEVSRNAHTDPIVIAAPAAPVSVERLAKACATAVPSRALPAAVVGIDAMPASADGVSGE